jgi:predicted phage tail protein
MRREKTFAFSQYENVIASGNSDPQVFGNIIVRARFQVAAQTIIPL